MKSGGYMQAGTSVRDYMVTHPNLQRLLGWTNQETKPAGAATLQPIPRGTKHRTSIDLEETIATQAVNFQQFQNQSKWLKGRTVYSQAGDECTIRSWVFCDSPFDSNPQA